MIPYYPIPFFFCPNRLLQHLPCDIATEAAALLPPVYAQPIGRGMVFTRILNKDDLLDVADFVRFQEKTSGFPVYDIQEVAWQRGMITTHQYQQAE